MILFDQTMGRFLTVNKSVTEFRSMISGSKFNSFIDWRQGTLTNESGKVLMRMSSYHNSHFELHFVNQGTDKDLDFLNEFLLELVESIKITEQFQIKRIEKVWYLVKLK